MDSTFGIIVIATLLIGIICNERQHRSLNRREAELRWAWVELTTAAEEVQERELLLKDYFLATEAARKMALRSDEEISFVEWRAYHNAITATEEERAAS